MTFYKNPIIGWFLFNKIKTFTFFLILFLTIYYLIIYNSKDIKSFGCNRPNCDSTFCTGFKCYSSGCLGNNCKAGDCYGERCTAGDCNGIGCRAGDCFGKDCNPGKCNDPTCFGDDRIKQKCIPFCFDGMVYNIPKKKLYKYTRYFAKNSVFNKNYCDSKKRTSIFKKSQDIKNTPYDEKFDDKIYNFQIDYVNLFSSGNTSIENALNPNELQKGKSVVLTTDIFFIDSTPNVLKDNNCNWYTYFKDNKITSSFRPYKSDNIIKWVPKNFLAYPLKSDGNIDSCLFGTHNLKIDNISDINTQINNIMLSKLNNILKNFSIDKIQGDYVTTKCIICSKKGYQYLNIDNYPTYSFNDKILPCKKRCYELEEITLIIENNNLIKYYIKNKNSKTEISKQMFDLLCINEFKIDITKPYYELKGHNINNFKLFDDKNSYNNYIYENYNKLKTIKNHHLFIYQKTLKNNDQIYKCYWCGIETEVNNSSLPRNKNNVNNKQNGLLKQCFKNNYYDHYMYDLIDNNKNVYQKCLKCNKNSYPQF